MKKIIIFLIVIFLSTACSVKYNVVINEDLSVIEKASLTGTTAFFNTYYKTTKKNVINNFLNQYKNVLDNNKYTYEMVNEKTPYVVVSKKYNSIKNYIDESILFNDYFDEIKYTEDGNIKRIETIGFNENNSDDPNRFDVKNLEITIICPYKVLNHNAKRVNNKTNTYYYELFEDGNNKILLEFDSGKKYDKNENTMKMLLIILLAILIIWIVVYVLNKKKNK